MCRCLGCPVLTLREGFERMLAYSLVWLLLCLFSGAAALGAPAHPVRGVRFGTHGALSRVVIDLREKTAYDIKAITDPTTIQIEFPAMTALPNPAVWRAQTPLVHEVAFVADAAKVIAEIRLAQAGSVQMHSTANSPPRIVIDISANPTELSPPTGKQAVPQAPAPGVSSQTGADRTTDSLAEAPTKQATSTKTAAVIPAVESPTAAAGHPATPQVPPGLPHVSPQADVSKASETKPALPVGGPSPTPTMPQTAAKASPQADTPKASEAMPAPAGPAHAQPVIPPPVAMPGVGQQLAALKAPVPKAPGAVLTSADLLGLAEYQWKQGQLDKALQSYKLFLEQFPTYPNNHFIAVRVADILRAQQDYRLALDAYARVLDTYPGTEGAFVSMMQMAELGVSTPNLLPDRGFPRYFPYHHPVEALQAFIQTYPLSPLAHVAQFKIGTLHLYRQELQTALDVFQQLLEKTLKPELRQEVQGKVRDTLQGMIDGYRQQGRDLRLLQTYFTHKALLAPEAAAHPDFLLPVAMSYAHLGLLPEAQSLLQTLLPLATTPEQRSVYGTELLSIFLQRGLLKEAREMFRVVEATAAPELRGRFLLSLGRLAWNSGQGDTAVQYLRQGQAVVTVPSERASLLSLLGEGYLAQGKPRESLQAFQQCVEVATGTEQAPLPEAETCLLHVARLQETQRQFPPALATYAALLQRFPQTPYRMQALLHMADIAQEGGDSGQVQTAYTALRDTGASVLWQKLGADALEEAAWRKKFNERLAEVQNQISR